MNNECDFGKRLRGRPVAIYGLCMSVLDNLCNGIEKAILCTVTSTNTKLSS
jgi:hypothetical protein